MGVWTLLFAASMAVLAFNCEPCQCLDALTKEALKVSYESGDCECTGQEKPERGPGPRTFSLSCKKGGSSTRCVYRGNPHDCGDYNNKGQRTFYEELLTNIGQVICPAGGSVCPRSQFYTQICGDMGRKNFEYWGGA